MGINHPTRETILHYLARLILITFATVRYVVHWDSPGSLEAYIQESGRAGRDDKSADCIMCK